MGELASHDRISAIVPARNEERRIGPCLEALLRCDPSPEVIVCDGGSTDRTIAVASSFRSVRVVRSPRPGRAAQMNHAATVARGDVLWFVHADCRVPESGARRIREALSSRGVPGGCFRFAVDSPRHRYRILERAVWLRTRWLRAPYGDQGLFVTRETFEAVGPFDDVPILEDLRLVRRLRRLGRLVVIAEPVVTSARRFERGGFLRTVARHQWILVLDRLGVPPRRLAKIRERGEPALAARSIQEAREFIARDDAGVARCPFEEPGSSSRQSETGSFSKKNRSSPKAGRS